MTNQSINQSDEQVGLTCDGARGSDSWICFVFSLSEIYDTKILDIFEFINDQTHLTKPRKIMFCPRPMQIKFMVMLNQFSLLTNLSKPFTCILKRDRLSGIVPKHHSSTKLWPINCLPKLGKNIPFDRILAMRTVG